jgi:hypothetical protein
MAILMQETTKGDEYSNHTYLLTDTKEFMLGYIRKGSRELKMFSSKIRFDRRYRTFKTIRSVPDSLIPSKS